MDKNDLKFDLEYQYQGYLQGIGQNEAMMHPEQREQVKNAFFGGIAVMVQMLHNDVATIEDEDKVADVLEGIYAQTKKYWTDKLLKRRCN